MMRLMAMQIQASSLLGSILAQRMGYTYWLSVITEKTASKKRKRRSRDMVSGTLNVSKNPLIYQYVILRIWRGSPEMAQGIA